MGSQHIQEAVDNFETLFDIRPEEGKSGICTNHTDMGIYFASDYGPTVYVFANPSNYLSSGLGLEVGITFIVYTDLMTYGGPVSGNVDVQGEVRVFEMWHDAKSEFETQMHDMRIL